MSRVTDVTPAATPIKPQVLIVLTFLDPEGPSTKRRLQGPRQANSTWDSLLTHVFCRATIVQTA